MSADLTVPPLPVVAYASDDTSELYTPAELADYIIERPVPLVRKADADAAIASMQARLDAAERDAARYRWLRDQASIKTPHVLNPADGFRCFSAGLDGVIDAATQEQPT
jgi:hypothetical protein